MMHAALEHIAQAEGLAPGVDADTAATLLENFYFGLLFRRAAGCAEKREMAEAALVLLLQTTLRDNGATARSTKVAS